jgi:tetraacyldisaccharide 4'-kinase
VTKCPPDLSTEDQLQIQLRLRPRVHQTVYFSSIDYDEAIYSAANHREVASIQTISKVLLAGIAKPQPFFNHLKSKGDVILKYRDHHHFSSNEILEIKKAAKNKIIITTEKDYVRLKNHFSSDQLYYLPMKSSFITGGDHFNNTIKNYVGKSTTNR